MRPRSIRALVASLVSLSLAACDSTTEPTPELTDFVLDFCSDQTPAFLAYQNQGGAWTRQFADANGTFALRVTPRFAVAIVHQVQASASSEFIYTTTSEMSAFNNVGCTETVGTKTLTGTLAGLPAGTSAMISMGGAYDYVTSPTTSYTLANLPSGSLDLVAQRETFVTNGVPDKIVIRRAQNLASTIPVVDFSSAEAQSFLVNTLTINGLSTSDDNYLTQNFNTATTQNHSIASSSFFTTSSQTLYGIPNTQVGDLHGMSLYAEANNGTSYRGENQYFRVPANRTATLGAALSTPTLTQATPAPYVRLRVVLPSQLEYNSLVSGFFEQTTSSSDRIVVVTATAGFFGGTPGTWQVEVPDLSAVAGFPTSAMLQTGTTTDWWVDAYSGAPAAFMGKPTDGTVLHYAGRSSSISTMQQFRAGARTRLATPLARREGLGAFAR